MRDPLITPEAVPLDLEAATVGSRGAAILLDLTIMGTMLFLLVLAQAIFDVGAVVGGWLGIALLLAAIFALQFGYPIGFETLWRGRTPGKAALGLRVVTVEGAPVGLRHATIRAAVGLLELTATLGALAVVTSLLSSRGQRLGDLAAGTLVIRERRAGSSLQARRFAPPPGTEAYVAQLDVSALGPADYATVRDVLQRAHTLAPGVREQVARDVAVALRGRVSPPPPQGLDPLRWLACVAAAIQQRSPRPIPTDPGVPSAAGWGAPGGGEPAAAQGPADPPGQPAPGRQGPTDPPGQPAPGQPAPGSADDRGGFAPPD